MLHTKHSEWGLKKGFKSLCNFYLRRRHLYSINSINVQNTLQFKDTIRGPAGPLCAKHKSSRFTKISKGSETIAQRDEKTVIIVAIGGFTQI